MGFIWPSQWLARTINESNDQKYRHQLLVEQSNCRELILDDLKSAASNALEDARRHLRKVIGIQLDPLSESPAYDPTDGYPERLELKTLKGYFGEFLAGVVAVSFEPLGIANWQIPIYLFRYHDVAFDVLEKWRQTGEDPGVIPGRFGDDCLAFQLDDRGQVYRVLVCESKCTADHRQALIADAHMKISEFVPRPVGIRQLIEALDDYDNSEASSWVHALRQYILQDTTNAERCDLVCYVCGCSPRRRGQTSWLPVNGPHTKYIGGRRLEAVEIHITGVDSLVCQVYGKLEEE